MDNVDADFIIQNDNPIQAEFELNESEHFDCSFELFAAGTVWGSISGDISNQTDLISALNDKQDVLTAGDNIQIEDNVISATDTTYTAGQGIDITNGVISNTQTSAEWGNIQGDISAQTDLYLILQDKASVESVENLAETVQNNYDTLDTKIDNTESVLAGQITALSDTVNINNQNINNRVDTVEENVSNLTDTVSDNYTELDGKISDNSDAISTINNTISGYGDIVTHNVNEFATAAQGDLADTALQSGDNISELNNNIGYITSTSLPTLEDLTTQAQLNAINSGATATNIGQITTNQNNIADIRDLIPSQTTSSNQLADKAFVNSSIATNTAYFIGTFNSVAELEAYSGVLTNNDYAFVATTDTAGNTLYDRYKYNADTQQWIFEYELNNSSFTAAQWAAINSGITSGDVSLIQSALQPNDNISELVNDAGYITSASLPTVNNGTLDIQVNGASIGTFTANQSGNTTANITIPDEVFWAQYGSTTAQEIAEALDADKIVMMIDDNKIYHLSAFNSSFFYFSCLNNQVSNYIVFNGATWSRGLKTLENTANKVTSLSATSTDTQYPSAKCVYDELQSIASSIPTVGNGTITFTQGGVTKGTITTNQSGNATIDFDAGGSGSSTWGSITGTLSNQTDLQNALNTKVSKSGDTMTGQLNINRETGSNFVQMRSGMVQRGTAPTSTITLGFMQISDKNGQWLGKNQYQYTTTGEAKMELSARSVTSDSTAKLSVGFDSSNRAFATAPATSTARTNSTDIITRGFLNSQGYIKGITSSDVTTALGYTPLSNATKYGSSLSYSSNVLQLLDQDGNALGGSVTIQSSPDIDNKSITTNLSDELQTVGVIDQNNTNTAIKTWTGTKAQYDAIVTKDANTLYNITDDTDVTLTLLEALYPIGSIYIGTMANCPLATLGVGTWQLKTSRFLVDKYSNGTDWWELYSDGWCRQGGVSTGTDSWGIATINLLKPYINTNYTLVLSPYIIPADMTSTGTTSIRGAGRGAYTNKTASSFGCQSNNDVNWQTEGYTSETTQLNQWERIS